jgi:mutator protein MutT
MTPAKLIAIAVVQHHDALLVGRRPDGVELAGCWEFPGGKVRDSEQPAEAAVRECREETGLEVRVVRLLQHHVHEYPHGTVDLRFYTCELVGEHAEPLAPFRWVARDQLHTLHFPAGNDQVLELLLA